MANKLVSVNFSISVGAKELQGTAGGLSSQKMNILSKYLTKELKQTGEGTPLGEAGKQARLLIRKRTLKGKDINGNEFKRLQGYRKRTSVLLTYSGKKKQALKKGIITKPTGSVAPPKANLYFKGPMLNSLGYFAGRDRSTKRFAFGITMGFRGNHHGSISNKRLAAIHHRGEGKMPARPFMGLNEGERVSVYKKFKAALTRDFAKRLK